MSWKIELTPEAKSHLAKLGASEAKRVLAFLNERHQKRENPRELGESLKGSLREYWRYRVGDYRIICRLEDRVITVFVVHICHRREVYKA
jgi:mRNA interferase RelE/StbE